MSDLSATYFPRTILSMSAIQRAAVDLSDRILQSVAAGHDLTALGAQWDLLAHYVEIASQTGSLVPSSAKAAYIAADRILCIGSSLSAVAQNGEALIAGLMADLELLDTRNATSEFERRLSGSQQAHLPLDDPAGHHPTSATRVIHPLLQIPVGPYQLMTLAPSPSAAGSRPTSPSPIPRRTRNSPSPPNAR